jgi:hypothetical protein
VEIEPIVIEAGLIDVIFELVRYPPFVDLPTLERKNILFDRPCVLRQQ